MGGFLVKDRGRVPGAEGVPQVLGPCAGRKGLAREPARVLEWQEKGELPMRPTVTRSREINVKLTEQVRQGLQEVAEAVGMAPSALASYAVGQFVAQHKAQAVAYSKLPGLVAQAVAGREAQ